MNNDQRLTLSNKPSTDLNIFQTKIRKGYKNTLKRKVNNGQNNINVKFQDVS